MSNHNRRTFLKLMGITAASSVTTMNSSIAKALDIAANDRTRSINDVEHIVILMQENRPFDHHFGTLRGVRGFSDPRAVKINLPLADGSGITPASVFLQPAGPDNEAAGYGVPPDSGDLGGPTGGALVIPPFQIDPHGANPALTYLPGTPHSWEATHACWNQGQHDHWPQVNGPIAMSYFTREDIPYYYALADAFTVGDNYYCSVLGPTNPNRMYMWTGCIGNLSNLGPEGTDGHGAGPATANGLSPNHAYWIWKTLPEALQKAGVSWKIYQDLAGQTFAPDFGDGTGNAFAGNFGDNSLLYFNQYLNAPPGTALFDNACTGTSILDVIPESGAPEDAWVAWAGHLFDQLRTDVNNDTLPQVSWIVAPAGYTEHSDWPVDYGAWYISQVFDILVSNPKVFSKTVFLINFDEADGSFDHIVPPCVPPTPTAGASTVSIKNEIVTTSEPNGPIGLGSRVPFLVISPWSKGGFVNSQVFDHTSVVQFIENRFRVHEPNISPWRRAVAGDLTSAFNFKNPNKSAVTLPSTDSLIPPPFELAGGGVDTFIPTQSDVVVGIPTQEPGIRPARALPYELNVHAAVHAALKTVTLTFTNTGDAAAVFHVRSGNVADAPRFYTVEPGKKLNGQWSVVSNYDLSVYGPNGFVRFFTGIIAHGANALDIQSQYGSDRGSSIQWIITNGASGPAVVNVFDAYTGRNVTTELLRSKEWVDGKLTLDKFHGWYDLIVTVEGDPVFKYRLAGHVETGKDSFSDPAMGGLVPLKG